MPMDMSAIRNPLDAASQALRIWEAGLAQDASALQDALWDIRQALTEADDQEAERLELLAAVTEDLLAMPMKEDGLEREAHWSLLRHLRGR